MPPASVVRPKLRRDVEVRVQPAGGVSLRRADGETLELSATEAALLQAMDGRRSARELLAALPPSVSASPSQLRALVGRLVAADLVEVDGGAEAEADRDGDNFAGANVADEAPSAASAASAAPTRPFDPQQTPAPLPNPAAPPTTDEQTPNAPLDDAHGASNGQRTTAAADPQALAAEMTALSEDDTALGAAGGAGPKRPAVLYDPALFSTNLVAVGVAIDPKELARLMADALAMVRRGAPDVAVDMVRNAASLAPGDAQVQAVAEALAPLLHDHGRAATEAALAACAAVAPAWATAAAAQAAGREGGHDGGPSATTQAPTPRPSAGGPAFGAARADDAPTDGLLAPPSRVPYRALAIALLILTAGAGAALWWVANQPELVQVRLRRLEPVRHALYEGGTAAAVRPHRAAWTSVPRAGEVTYLASLRAQVGPRDDVLRVTLATPGSAAKASPPAASPAASPAATAALTRRLAAAQRRYAALQRRSTSGHPTQKAAAARARALAAARSQIERLRAELTKLTQATTTPTQPPRGREAAELAVRAPFPGTVAELRLGIGERVRPGAPAVLVIDRTVVHLRFVVPAGAPHAVGDKLTLAVDVAAPPEREARITEVHPAGKNVALELELADPQLALPLILPPQSFRLIREVTTACFVPKEALSCTTKTACTLWQMVSGKAEPRRVRAIETVSDGAWIAWDPAPDGKEAPLILGSPTLPLAKLTPGLAVQPSVL